MRNKEQTISNLKKLKSFHNGSFGADIDRAIKALKQISVIEQIIEGTEYIQEDVIRYKMICEVLEDKDDKQRSI